MYRIDVTTFGSRAKEYLYSELVKSFEVDEDGEMTITVNDARNQLEEEKIAIQASEAPI